MSLLNDALKKKQREDQLPAGLPASTFRPPAPSRRRLYLLIGVAAIVSAGIAGMLLYSSPAAPPLHRLQQLDTSAPAAAPPRVAPATTVAATSALPPVVAPKVETPPRSRAKVVAGNPLPSKPAASKKIPAPLPVKTVAQAAKKEEAPLAATPAPANPQPPALTDDLDPNLQPYFEKAQSYQQQQRPVEAAALYRQILQQAPRHRSSKVNLVTCLLQSGAYREAYDRALPLSKELPEDGMVWLNLATAEIGSSEYRPALQHLREAELHHAPRFELFLNRGVANSRLGEWDQAFAAYREAGAIAPAGDSALPFNLALAQDKKGDLSEAAQAYEKFLESAPATHPKRTQVNERLQAIRRYLATQAAAARP